ncbi:hypothetical protein DFJ77DRAFT_440213 [Powellomyces hirtus]|nr:hypothetical protein DFJ77DRAFT_440213 [Powellomyces hirtus]
MAVTLNNSSLLIAATAAVGATLALLLVGPPTTHRKKLVRKIQPPAEPASPQMPAPQLSASWSFVDQSNTQLQTFATLFRARDHAESIYSALSDPESYYPTTRQSEFGVEILDRESGLIRFIRYRRSRSSQGDRVVVERRLGEDHSGGDFDSTGSWFIDDTFCVFNTTVTIRHTLRVVEEEQPKEDESAIAAVGVAVNPSTSLEIEVCTRGPAGTAFMLAHKYAERMETALSAIENTWSGKDMSNELGPM